MDIIKNIFKNKINVLSFFVAFLGAFMLFPNYFEAYVMPLPLSKDLWMSLDPSWGIAMNYVKIKNLNWGTDVAFTYGPLAHFCTRVGWGETRLSFIFFDVFMFINYFAVFFLSLQKSKNKRFTLLLIISVCIIFPLWIGAANALVLMAFLIFWIRLSLDNPKSIYYIFQIAIITLVFFIKFNTGLIAFPLFLAGIICNLIANNGNKWALLTYLIAPVVFITITSQFLNVALIPYIKSGFEFVSGYNDVMFLDNQIKSSLTFVIVIVLLFSGILVSNIYSNQKKDWIKIATILFLFGTAVFVLYKQAFVRADVGHINDFFRFILLVSLCNLDLHEQLKNSFSKTAFIIASALPFYFLFFIQENQIEIKSKFPKSNYISRCEAFTSTSGMFLFNNNCNYPPSVLNKIGNKTVDVYPWNIQLIIENKLNYLPRPALQSYTVYTPYLANLDFEHYNNYATAPEFVVYEFASIDERYPLFDESRVNLALFKNYEAAELFEIDGRKVLLLQKKKEFKPITFEKTNEYAMLLNSPLVPKKDSYYEIGIYNSMTGKIASLFNHSPEIRLEINLKSGGVINYRTSKLLLEIGLFSDKYFSETKSFKSNFDLVNDNQEVKYYNFKPLNPSSFKDKIRITEYKIKQ
jgi:hypothetical protein